MNDYLKVFPFTPNLWPTTESDYLMRIEAGEELPIGKLASVLDTSPTPYYAKHFEHYALKDVPIAEIERLERPEAGAIVYDFTGKQYTFVEFVQTRDNGDWIWVASMADLDHHIELKDLYLRPPVIATATPAYTLQLEGRTPINDHSYVSLYLAQNTDVEKAVALLPRPYQHLQLVHLKNQLTAIVVTYNELTTINTTN